MGGSTPYNRIPKDVRLLQGHLAIRARSRQWLRWRTVDCMRQLVWGQASALCNLIPKDHLVRRIHFWVSAANFLVSIRRQVLGQVWADCQPKRANGHCHQRHSTILAACTPRRVLVLALEHFRLKVSVGLRKQTEAHLAFMPRRAWA